jgi:hypothetical protein
LIYSESSMIRLLRVMTLAIFSSKNCYIPLLLS